MREILFRGKRVDNDEWIYGDLRHWRSGNVGIHSEELHSTLYVDPETVGQYTEQPDKYNEKIFEWDILRGYFDGAHERVGVVVFDDGRWEVHSQSGLYIAELTECHKPEVIGNIHDNPELLKEDEQ